MIDSDDPPNCSSSAAGGRSVLFVHGWWGGSWVWDLFRERFAELGYDPVAIELSGSTGELGDGIGRVSTEEHFMELKAAVESLGDPILIGHSFGGLLIQMLVEQRRLPAAVLICPAPPRGIFSLRSWTLLTRALRYAPRMFGQRTFLPTRADMLYLNLNGLSADEQTLVMSRMVPASGKQLRETAVQGVPVDATRVETPMLVMVGKHDRLTPPSVCRAIAQKYGAEFRQYPDNAHYLMREPNHREIADDIHRWLCETVEADEPAATRR